MGRLLGRAPTRAAALLFALLTRSALASAQDDEVIADPELSGSGPTAPSKSGGAGEEVIADPELGDTTSSEGGEDFGWGPVFQVNKPGEPPPEEEEEEYDPLANTGMAKLELASQVGVDLRQEGDLEDAYETRLRFGGEIELRRSRRLRLVIGSRVDFFWAVPGQNDKVLARRDERALDQDRFEVDLIPTAAYADMTLFDGFHLRVGQQVVSLGRMDFYSPTDALCIYDMRPQPKLDPAASKMAQPAVRLDWDLGSSVTLQAAYVPWFSPHLSRPNRDQYLQTVTSGAGAALTQERTSGIIDPSWQTKSSEANIRFVSPPPDFTTPQAQARLVYRSHLFEVAGTAATALDKIPAVYLTPALEAYQVNPADTDSFPKIYDAISRNELLPLFDVEYHRYTLVGGDFGFDLGPVSLGFEFAYSPSRHLYAATKDGKHLAQPNVSKPITDNEVNGSDIKLSNVRDERIRAGVPVVQSAMHAEWVKGESIVVGGEVFWVNALELPYDRSRDWWGFIPNTGAYVAGTLGASYLLNDGQWRFETTSIFAVGPSVVLVPHVELRAREGLYIDVGAQIYEGPAVGYTSKVVSMGTTRNVTKVTGAQNINLGGLLSGYDQVFVGLRWLP